MTLTETNLADLRTSLVAERRRILFNIDALTAEFKDTITGETDENGLESHLADQGTNTFLRQRDLSAAEHEEKLLDEIDAAIKRIDNGTYGTCEIKQHPIPKERLEAQPWARTCIEHADML